MTDGFDLGHGVIAHVVEDSERVVGFSHEHPAARVAGTPYPEGIMPDGRCGGFMPLAGRAEGVVWTVEAGDPDSESPFAGLTLSPSSLCRACGHHGWIRDGQWVPA